MTNNDYAALLGVDPDQIHTGNRAGGTVHATYTIRIGKRNGYTPKPGAKVQRPIPPQLTVTFNTETLQSRGIDAAQTAVIVAIADGKMSFLFVSKKDKPTGAKNLRIAKGRERFAEIAFTVDDETMATWYGDQRRTYEADEVEFHTKDTFTFATIEAPDTKPAAKDKKSAAKPRTRARKRVSKAS